MALRGLITRKEIWVPTYRGLGLVVVLFALCVTGILYGIHPFLAINHPQGQGILIVEGWLSDKDLDLALPLLKSQAYHVIITTGGALDDDSIYRKLFPNKGTWADVVAAQIIALGISVDRVKPVPRPPVEQARTYASAIAVRQWLDQADRMPHLVDVLTIGSHARRSWMLFGLALGDRYTVGVIALEDRHYDELYWWRSSEGVKTVLKETVGYLYAKFLFWPDA